MKSIHPLTLLCSGIIAIAGPSCSSNQTAEGNSPAFQQAGGSPSEAEFVYAAAGGNEQRRFPWGSQEPGADSVHAIYDCSSTTGHSARCDKTTSHIAPVGTARLGAGRWRHLDFVGNLVEWYLDWYAPTYVSPCTDCANLSAGSGRALRDGYFASTDKALLLASSRNNGIYPTNHFYSFGFRCARAPKP